MVAVVLAFITLPGQTQPLPGPPPRGNPTPSLAAFPNLQAYDLGTTTLTQTGVPEAWQQMPLPLTGTLALPRGAGPFPVVVVLHGRHAGCHFADAPTPSQWPCPTGTETRFDQGFAYLAQALAQAGYLVLIPNLNGAYANAYGVNSQNRNDLTDERSLQTIEAHLSRLANAHQGQVEGFPQALKGQVDLTQLALIGHSLGGGAAVLAARQPSLSAAFPAAPGQGPVSALLLLSPTPSRSMETEPEAYRLPDVPTSIVVGGCDRDIFDLSSLYYFESAAADLARQTPVAAMVLLGGNHNFFNAAVKQDDYYRRPDYAPLCDPQQSALRLSRVDQETFLVQYALDFLGATLGTAPASTSAALGQDPRQGAPGTLYGFSVLTNLGLPSHQRWISFNPAQPVNQTISPVASGSVTVEVCQPFQPCGSRQSRHPQFPAGLYVTWQAAGGQLQFPITGPTNLQYFHSLQLRLATEPGRSSPPSGFAVVLRDQSGQAVRVEIPTINPTLRQLPSDPTYGSRNVPIYPSAVRIPLPQFRGVNLSQLSSIDLVFDAGTEGEIYMGTVEFLGQGKE